MHKSIVVLVCLILAGAALACDAGAAAPTPTLMATAEQPTAAPTIIDITATPAAPTEIPTTSGGGGATEAPTAGIPTDQPSFPTPTPIAGGGIVTRVQIYLIAVGDNGKSGPMIGCQDSVVAVDRDIAPTRAPLQAALGELLSLKDEFYGQSGLRNALYGSSLKVDKVVIDDGGLATINLSGTMSLAGECDDPRFKA